MAWTMRKGRLVWAKAHKWDHPGVRFKDGVLVSRELVGMLSDAPMAVVREVVAGLWGLRPEDNTLVFPPSSGKLWLKERGVVRKAGGKNSVRWMLNPALARAGGGKARPLDLWEEWEKLGGREGGQDGSGSSTEEG